MDKRSSLLGLVVNDVEKKVQQNWNLVRGGHGDGGHDLRVRVVGIEGQGVAPTDLKSDGLAGRDGLEHGDHVVVGEAEDARVVDEDQNVACENRIF